jgi:hypothetical protein
MDMQQIFSEYLEKNEQQTILNITKILSPCMVFIHINRNSILQPNT